MKELKIGKKEIELKSNQRLAEKIKKPKFLSVEEFKKLYKQLTKLRFL